MAATSRSRARLLRQAILPAVLLCLLFIGAGHAQAHARTAPAVSVAVLADAQIAIASPAAADDHDPCRHGALHAGHHTCASGASCQAVGLVQGLTIAPTATCRSMERQAAALHSGRDIAPLFHPPKTPRRA